MRSERGRITKESRKRAVAQVLERLDATLAKHRSAAFISPQEALGTLTVRLHRVANAVDDGTGAMVAGEFNDLAAVAICALASMIENGDL